VSQQAVEAGTAVRKSIVVAASPERAFKVFTEGMALWWPMDSHHIGQAPMRDAVMEQRAGGRWYELGEDGSKTDWGSVVAWDPPERVLLTWQLNDTWAYDPAFVTELEVRFIAEDEGHTRVELEHRNLDRYGDKRQEMVEAFSSEGGWTGLLKRFGTAAAGA
jgi:uncharacterized protein YndB with AHSA1/START domain